INLVATHRTTNEFIVSGGTVEIENTLTYAGPVGGLSWSVLPPNDDETEPWTYVEDGAISATTRPELGEQKLLEWSWASPPPSPIVFHYTLTVPNATELSADLHAMAAATAHNTDFETLATPSPLSVQLAQRFHSADTNHDYRLDLGELLRVIELYNVRQGTERTGRYREQSGTVDGFAADFEKSDEPPIPETGYHSADTNQDLRLSLPELLRLIELYNVRSGTSRSGHYQIDPETEDGFSPFIEPNP
ncbi:MAG: hypothetical protein NXI02_33525, partial [Rhodobacteraceae bacterium]|nr:hypothetical protein [Paracoccaceae bacterium]